MIPPSFSITLYSNPGCPAVHRVLTTLNELSIPYNPIIIDIEVPREPWYLKINPRGTVPSLSFSSPEYNDGKEVIITESLVIIYFLADLVPGVLLPALGGGGEGEKAYNGFETAAKRARILFFIDTWEKKIDMPLIKVALATVTSEESAKAAVEEVVRLVEVEIEPLLVKRDGDGDGAFFGGKGGFTLAEIFVGPFILRNFTWADAGVVPPLLKEKLLALPHFGKWAEAIVKHESLLKDYDEKFMVEKTLKKLQEFKDGTFKPKSLEGKV